MVSHALWIFFEIYDIKKMVTDALDA